MLKKSTPFSSLTKMHKKKTIPCHQEYTLDVTIYVITLIMEFLLLF